LLVSVSLLAIFVTVWTLYGVISAAPAAIHNDMAEAYVWGRQFELGYFQHMPLSPRRARFTQKQTPSVRGIVT
jgi:hypothetical protein